MLPLALMLAGSLGVLSRHLLSLAITASVGHAFPFATVLINVLGSFCIGLSYVAGIERSVLGEALRVAVMTGFLGGFTTFSSFSLETVRLLAGGQWGLGVVNVGVSVLGCLAATVAGLAVARAILN